MDENAKGKKESKKIKSKTSNPRKMKDYTKMVIQEETVIDFYSSLTTEEDMMLETCGEKKLVEGEDRRLLKAALLYCAKKLNLIDTALLDAGAGFGVQFSNLI